MKIQFLTALALWVLLCFSHIASAITIQQTLDEFVTPSEPAYTATTGLQTGRLNRGGVGGSCGSSQSPNEFSSVGDRRFDQYRFVALTSGCVTVTLSNAGDGLLFAAAYNQFGISLSDTTANYLADMGSSPTNAVPSVSFSFDVVAGQVFHVVVHEVNTDGGVGQAYTLDVDGVKLEPDFTITETLDNTTPVPNPGDNGVTGLQTGRIDRNGVSSTCDAPKPPPSLFTAVGGRQIDSYELIPTTTGCAVFSLTSDSGSIHLVAYDENGFNPFDPTANYLADTGSSAVGNTVTMSMLVTAGVPISVVLHEVNPGASLGTEYTLNISNQTMAHTIEINSVLDLTAPFDNPDWTVATAPQNGRLNRNGVVSDCSALKANPGLGGGAGNRQVDSYTFVPMESGCVEVTLGVGSGNLFSTAYDDMGLNTSDPSLNHIADMGFSVTDPLLPQSYGVNVVAGVPFTVAVSEVDPGASIGAPYTLTLKGKALYPLQNDIIFEDGFE